MRVPAAEAHQHENEMSKRYSVVIPVYNSSACLPELVRRLDEVFGDLGGDHEILMVDDCSPDDSWNVIAELAQGRPHLKAVQLLRNSGQIRATIAGIRLASGDVVITMDDDLQHDPALLPQLLGEFERDGGCDCLFAYFPQKKHAGYRNVASRLISWMNAQAIGSGEKIKLSSFRIMRDYVADIVRRNQSASATIGSLILTNAAQIRSIPIAHRERMAGRSNYTLARQFRAAFDSICSVSMLPLRMISAAGLIVAGLSGVLLGYYLLKYFLGGPVQAGFTTLVILVTFFSGAILLSLGVIGEYLVRVLRELQRTSVSTVRRTVGFGAGGVAAGGTALVQGASRTERGRSQSAVELQSDG
jgi:dolichol-phosphate mannosyltransferase/undecaprenyl-phosphate 4-deoxy-4-formamido-L-arabinose transferase